VLADRIRTEFVAPCYYKCDTDTELLDVGDLLGRGRPLEAVWVSFVFGGFCSVVLAVLWVRSAVWMRAPFERAVRRSGGRRWPTPATVGADT
jgi:hypothetical protein